MKSKVAQTFALLLLILPLTSCSTSKNAGLNLGISLSPSKAFIVPGDGSSCSAQAAAKADGSVPGLDITGDRVLFTRFAIQWRSGDKLTIAGIKATVFSSGIEGADGDEGLEVALDNDEVAAMLGLAGLTIQHSNPYDAERKFNIDSTDASLKGATSPYVPCGFQIGGFTSKKGINSYTARIKVEVVGYKTACVLQPDLSCKDGEQSPVRQTVSVTAERY